MKLNFYKFKEQSEEKLKSYGVKINLNLPVIDYQGVRNSDEIIKRITIMAGMVYIAHQAPPSIIKGWIEEQDLFQFVTKFEKGILEKSEIEVTPTEIMRLKWYVESLWALVWVLGINNNFLINEPVGDNLIQMVPDVKKKQNSSTIKAQTLMRNDKEIYEQVDLYYRLHWYVVDARLKGIKQNKFNEGTIMERRKAFEWVVTPCEEWDEIDLST